MFNNSKYCVGLLLCLHKSTRGKPSHPHKQTNKISFSFSPFRFQRILSPLYFLHARQVIDIVGVTSFECYYFPLLVLQVRVLPGVWWLCSWVLPGVWWLYSWQSHLLFDGYTGASLTWCLKVVQLRVWRGVWWDLNTKRFKRTLI